MKLKWIGFISAVALVVMVMPSALRADVRDNAKIFSQSAVDDATTAMKKMERVHNKQLVVETFGSVPDDQKAAAASNSDDFFKKWMASRAKELKVNGVYMLICMDPHHLEVGAGKNTINRGDFTEEDIHNLYAQVKDDLHDKNYDKGLSDAVDTVERAYTANISSPAGRSSMGGGETEYSNGGYHSSSRSVPSAPQGSTGMGISLGSLICLGVAAVIIISLIKSIFRGNSGGGNYGGGVNYPQGGQNYGQNYGGGGFGYGNMGGGGGGFGRGFLGGLLGGALGGYAADKFDHRNDQSNAGFGQGDNSGGFGGGGGGGSFDSGPSDAGQGFGDSGTGGDFSSGGGGDSGGGGGSSGGDF